MPELPAQCDLLPLVIGVSGYRDLRECDLPVLRDRVRHLIDGLRHECPTTPLWLLSPLAEGADRLVAKVVLECGARMIVPLPTAPQAYEQDFASEESRDEFRTLLDRAAECFELPPVKGDASLDAFEEHENNLTRAYAGVGAFIALHSQLLIALWDGTTSDVPEDTWQVVEFMHDGVPEPFAPPTSSLYDRETGPVYHILAHREGDVSPIDAAAQPHVIYPGDPAKAKRAAALQRRLRRTVESFNRDALRHSARRTAARASGDPALLGDERAVTTVRGLSRLVGQFELVDGLAIHYQRQTLRTLKVLLTLSFIAVVLLQSYLADVGPHAALLSLYALVVALAFGYFWLTKWLRHENKYLDYRALAEGLRVQVFWRLAGLSHCVADYYLRRQRGVLEWVRNAIRAWTLADLARDRCGSSPVDGARLSSIQRDWVEDQAAYFHNAASRNRRAARWLTWLGHALVVVGVALAGLDVWLGPSQWLVLASILFPVAAALLCLYVNQRALKEHANQYERMADLFSDAATRLGQRISAGDIADGQQLIFDIGEEALAENADWVIMHRDRPLETPSVA